MRDGVVPIRLFALSPESYIKEVSVRASYLQLLCLEQVLHDHIHVLGLVALSNGLFKELVELINSGRRW